MPFIRVRSVSGAAHEFDAPVGLVDAHPGDFEVVAKEPVEQPRSPKFRKTRPKASSDASTAREGEKE